jgi:phosphoglycerate dehydrogenase-like enzyme
MEVGGTVRVVATEPRQPGPDPDPDPVDGARPEPVPGTATSDDWNLSTGRPDPAGLAVAVAPRSAPWIDGAVTSAGARLAPLDAASALVWTAPDQPDELEAVLRNAESIDWVQLPWAGIDPYVELIRRRNELVWTCAKGVYSDPVAEHALALLLAGFRHLGGYSRATEWGRPEGRNLFGARVTIVGGGGIARVLVDLLAPFRCQITVVRRSPGVPVDSAGAGSGWNSGESGELDETGGGPALRSRGRVREVSTDQLADALDGAEAVVLALPLLAETRGMIGAEELARLAPGAWLVNVARGEHIDTDALVAALDSGHLGGAALDVTDPEPLPTGHRLWGRGNVIITPHTANTPEMARPLLSERISTNVANRIAGRDLVGVIRPDLGY